MKSTQKPLPAGNGTASFSLFDVHNPPQKEKKLFYLMGRNFASKYNCILPSNNTYVTHSLLLHMPKKLRII